MSQQMAWAVDFLWACNTKFQFCDNNWAQLQRNKPKEKNDAIPNFETRT